MTKNKDGRDGLRCTLVMEGGQYNVAMSCLRTLQDLGTVGKGTRITLAGETLTLAEYEAVYNTASNFRMRIMSELRRAYGKA